MVFTRRYFLQSSGAIAAYLGLAPLPALGNLAISDEGKPVVKKRKTLVVIFLRGGADGLNLIVPHGDPAYKSLRPSLALSPPGNGNGCVLDLDEFFGLHPRMRALLPYFQNGLAVAAHAVGYDKNTRSHFEEQDVWETGIVGNTINSDGWLNRHLATSQGNGLLRAVAIGDTLPRILHGEAPAFAVRGIEDLQLPKIPGSDGATVAAALEHAYRSREKANPGDAREFLTQVAGTTLAGVRELAALTKNVSPSQTSYPRNEFAGRLQQVATLIRADVGLEVAEVDFGGWDTHRNQGRGSSGTFGNLVERLATGISAFLTDLEDRLDEIAVVTLTDFGRTAAENGSGGTDHGWGNCLLAFGGPVAKANRQAKQVGAPGRVVAKWPGLGPDQLHQGRDLLHTTDFRNVLAELVSVHLGNPDLKTVLPGHRFEPVGLIGH